MKYVGESRPSRFIRVLTVLFAASLGSCAMRTPHAQSAPHRVCPPAAYATLSNEEPPFRVDTAGKHPFSRWNIPWADDDIVGLNVRWLKRPASYAGLPEFALVINEYSKSEGLLCLVDQAGRVRASMRGQGLIQKVWIAEVAPVSGPQLLVYTNPDHGTGAQTGKAVLVEVVGPECRVLESV